MARRNYGPQAPKPYGFVDIEPLEKKDRRFPQGHERYQPGTVSGRIEATLIVATPLHVSSGQIRLREGREPPLVREITRVDDAPCIPASTLKGVVRSVAEAITKSCVRITRAGRGKLPSGAAQCRNKKNLCLACRMFGSLGFEGHVRFDDAVLSSGGLSIKRMPSLYRPRSRKGVYYDHGKVKGRKFYQHGQTVTDADTPVEVLTAQSQLAFRIRFENLLPAEVGVLLTAVGLGKPSLTLKFGGGKPACYGSAVVALNHFQVWEAPEMLYTSYTVERSDTSPQDYLAAAKDVLLTKQLQQLAHIWRYDMSRECPEGNY